MITRPHTPPPAPDSAAPIEDLDVAGVVERSMPAFSRAANLREIPDVRDGFFPGRRRIMFTAARELGLTATSDRVKSARLVGEVMGKYHPHGDIAIYGGIENVTAPYKIRYPLFEGQGNWGSIDGDGPAAMRYTEVRMTRLGEQVVRDLFDENPNATVPWRDNYDGKLREPALLPARFPILLANGIDGIGNGYACMVLPHNLRELIAAACALIDNPNLSIDKLFAIMPGPDFPGGATMVGEGDWKQILETGVGRITCRAKMHLEDAGRRQRIVVTELPFRVNKGKRGKAVGIIEQIEKKTNGTPEDRARGKTPPLGDIVDSVNDESGRAGMRLVIALEPGVSAERAVNALFAETGLQTSYTANYTVWSEGLPETLGTRDLLKRYLEFQFSVVTRRTKFFLARDEDELAICEAKVVAHGSAEKVVRIIRASDSTPAAADALRAEFKWTERQASAIVAMAVGTFARLNMKTIEDRMVVLKTNIAEYKRLLGSKNAMNELLKDELREIATKYGDGRRTEVDHKGSAEIRSADEMIQDEPCWLTVSESGLVARLRGDAFKATKRGTQGVLGAAKPDEDPITETIGARTRDRVWLLTNEGNLFGLRVADVEEVARGARGMNVRRFLNMSDAETVTRLVVPSTDNSGEIVIATANGKVLRSRATDYVNLNAAGLKAIGLTAGDKIVSAFSAKSGMHLITVSSDGYSVRFNIDDVPIQGRSSQGVASQRLGPGATVVSISPIEPDDTRDLAIVLSNGKGKRSRLVAYPEKGRATRGVLTADLGTASRGAPASVIFAEVLDDDDEVMFTTSSGKAVVMGASQIKRQGRATAGVITVLLSASAKSPETVTGGTVRAAETPEKIVTTKPAPKSTSAKASAKTHTT